MNEMHELRIRAAALLDQLLGMFPPDECAALLRHMAAEVEHGRDIARWAASCDPVIRPAP